MTGSELLKDAEDKMSKTIEVLSEELKTIRTGRPNPDIFKRVRVECYGTSMSVQDVAAITVPDGRSFLIQPFDKSNLKAIEQAILNSDLGLNPSNDGQQLRISVPALTEDRRKEFIKQVSKLTEEKAHIPIRNIRRDINDQLKQMKGDVSEDELKKLHDNLDKLTSKYNEQANDIRDKKQDELSKV